MGIFDGILDSVVGGAGDIVKGVIGGFFGQEAQKDTNEANWQIMRDQQAFSANQAQRAMDFAAQQTDTQRWWNKGEADTVWQRTVKDMENAGLSPMLAYSQGHNPVIPSSAASGTAGGTPSSPTMTSPKATAVQTALQSAAMAAQIDKTHAEAEATRASIPKMEQETRTGAAQEENVRQATRNAVFTLERILPAEEARTLADAALRALQGKTEEQRPRLVSFQADVEYVRYKHFEAEIKATVQRQHLTATQEAEIMMRLPGLYNQMQVDLNAYGRNVRPYVGDVGRLSGAASGLGLKLPNQSTMRYER